MDEGNMRLGPESRSVIEESACVTKSQHAFKHLFPALPPNSRLRPFGFVYTGATYG
jgi:hypothetical protein